MDQLPYWDLWNFAKFFSVFGSGAVNTCAVLLLSWVETNFKIGYVQCKDEILFYQIINEVTSVDVAEACKLIRFLNSCRR